MISTSVIQHDECSDSSVFPVQTNFTTDKNTDAPVFLELVVTDSLTGMPVPRAMISIDSQCLTAVCDDEGKASIPEVLSGHLILDVIIWGYRASSMRLFLSGRKKSLHIKMIRHC
ncbi:MAG: hypothetical protein V4708_05290 [Bacteroidota bacterium]